jgi:hypothetical protein
MIILNVDKNKVKSFEQYVGSLSKKAKKNWKYVKKHNTDLKYKLVEYRRDKLKEFMDLWELQPIRGECRRWAFGLEYPDMLQAEGKFRLFAAFKGEEIVAMHFVEVHGGYVECHPPMYDKAKYSTRYLAKYMWFELIRYAIYDPEMEWIDFGGGDDGSWRRMIKERDKYPNPTYKWIYIPEEVKKNPDKQEDFALRHLGGEKFLAKL